MYFYRYAILTCLVLMFGYVSRSCAEDAQSEGKQLADAFLLNSEFALEDHYMVANLEVNSDPLAPELLTSTGTMERLVDGNEEFTRVNWRPKIHADDREKNLIHVFNTGVLREEGVLDGERFILISNSLVHPSFPGTVSNASNINNHSCLHPFEFPVASMGMFTNERPRKERGASAIFKRFVCRKVDRNGDKFVTYWTPTTDTVMVVNRITFHDDTIPVFEWFANDTKSTFEKFDYTSGKRRILASHRTKWVDFNGIKVPSEVTMYLNHGSDNRQGYNIDVQIEYFDKTSKKYSEFQKRIGNSKKLVAAERIKANELSGAQ